MSSNAPAMEALNSGRQQAYLQMKVAIERFEQVPNALPPQQKIEVERIAERLLKLQRRVLQSPEASMLYLGEQELDVALDKIRGQFDSEQAFEQALHNNALDQDDLRQAVKDELLCDAVLEYACKDIAPISEQRALEFYQQHPDKFTQPARCRASHILITINDDFPENREQAAWQRIMTLAEQADSSNFSQLALRHSECPTAMNGGELGWVEGGQLFPALDKCLFRLSEGELSPVLRSEIGFHLLLCHQQQPAHCVEFEHAKAQIQDKLYAQQRKQRQRVWLASLMG
ncbi:nitrogen fixation protein NifM [Aliagarivorans taiwanensis]|uniref:nitrogen fixation protein NifM n=1 Tax=Aliagarivorans taiwanensis TaxID=561966 RepID=UPI00040345BE|nr:nitrogen fixation protein NifM [Aliagarivorans taiwanensis]